MIYAPVFMLPHWSLQLSSKKKQLFFIHFAFSLSISKKCCVVLLTTASAYYVNNTMQCHKNEKIQRQRCGLTCSSDKKDG